MPSLFGGQDGTFGGGASLFDSPRGGTSHVGALVTTNETPHERLFGFPRRAMIGTSMPTWPMSPSPALLRRFVRTKGEPLCDEVELLDANPTYAHVRYPNGNERTVSTSDLASAQLEHDHNNGNSAQVVPASDVVLSPTSPPSVAADQRVVQNKDRTVDVTTAPEEDARVETPRQQHSCRERRPPERLGEWTIQRATNWPECA